MGAQSQTRLDQTLARLATLQHGVVSRPQLFEIGFSRRAISRRIQAGRLHRIHSGVYAVGHRKLSREGRWMAAVLAGGENAILSHHAAAALWGLLPFAAKSEVTLPRVRRSRHELRFHCSALPADEIAEHDGIPVTTVARTLFDLAATSGKSFDRAFREAEYRRLSDEAGLTELFRRYPGQRGTARIRRVLAETEASTGRLRSDLEQDFLAFLRRRRLPLPETNATIELTPGQWIEVDCLWRKQRVIVELDGRGAHTTRSRFDSDRARDRRLAALGWRVVRVTRKHLGTPLATDLRTLLS
jgi:very-short-patch-repair endonuclease